MKLLHTIHHPSRIHDAKFCKRVSGEGEILLVGAEDKKLSVYDIQPQDASTPPTIIAHMVGHGNRYLPYLTHSILSAEFPSPRLLCDRVKAVQTLEIALPPSSGRTSTTIVTTVCSDGKIRVFDLFSIPVTSDEVVAIEADAVYDTHGTRLTCVTLADGDIPESKVTNGKRKHDVDEVEDGNDPEEVNPGNQEAQEEERGEEEEEEEEED